MKQVISRLRKEKVIVWAKSTLMIGLVSVILAGCTSADGPRQASSAPTTGANPSGQVMLNESIQNVEESNPILQPEVREFSLSPELEQELKEKKQPMRGLFETTMEADKADGKIDIHFSLKNISGKDLQITYGSGQKYDVWIYNEKDEAVYQWSLNKAFTQALIAREFKNSEVIEFDEGWDLHDNEGSPVPPGQYSIMVKVMIGLETGTISQDELTARFVVEI